MPRLFFALSALLILLSCAVPLRQASVQGPPQLSIPGFDEPLIHLTSQTYIPLKQPLEVSGTAIDRLLDYLALNRGTPWEASIQLNLGLAYYRNGYFSQTFPALERAWQLSRNETRPALKALADRAFGELVRMHARLGHADRVEALLASVQERTFTGPATETVAGAEEGLWMMRHHPGITYLCGAKALYSLLEWQHPGAGGLAVLDAYRSGKNGISLAQLTDLARRAGMEYYPVYSQEIPVPSVIHWKVNHYAAIVARQGDLYQVKDPTFGRDLWLTQAAIDSQASGYFLVPDGRDGQPVQLAQAERIYGQGYTASSDQDRTTPCDQVKSKAPCDGTKPTGMAHYDVHTMLVSLNITDTPIRYTPPVGHPIGFTLRYNQREANQPANFSFGNLGPKWTHNWLTYIEDSPTHPAAVVHRIVAGGGAVNYSGYDAQSGEYASGVSDSARLVRVSSDPIVYERRLQGGGREIYSVSDGAVTGIRRVFLSRKIDAKGNSTTLHYDARLRLTRVVDALGRATVLAYEHPADDLLITRITDPFGQQALIEYDSQGRLTRITDPIGMVSAFRYDDGHFITAMDTPYGRTTFAYSGNGTSRTLVITDPHGEKERVEYGQSLGVPRFVSDVPKGNILTRDKYHEYRNTAYWDKQTYRDYGRDITKAEVSHWLHTKANKTSGLLETFKKPLENRIWYNYPGQTSPIYVTNITQEKHSRIGRVLDDGASQVFIRRFNDYGKLIYQEDPLGHYVKYHYAANQIDLMQITRLRGGIEETVATFSWDDRHNLLSATDGRGHTTTYTYNDAGQMLSRTNALGQVTRFDYDVQGYLVRVTHPSGRTERFGYDEVGRLAAYTDTYGHTRTHLYDALNRLVRTDYEDGTFIAYRWDRLDLVRVQDRLGRVTRYEYDALGRKVAETDPLGRQTRYSYDASGRLLSVTDPLGQVTRYEYDIQGRPTAHIDAEGRRTDYVYERTTSRLARIIDAKGEQTEYAYDRANRLVAVTDPGGHTTGYLLDEVGNLLERLSPDSGLTLYRYDVTGNPVQKTDARGVTADYRYDALNRLQQIRFPDSAIEFSYDGADYGADIPPERRRAAIGKRTGMRDQSGHTRWYYNLNGDIEQIDTFFDDLGDAAWSQHFDYDYGYEPGAGRLVRYRYPDGQTFDYSYDEYGRINGIDSIAEGFVTPVVTDVQYHKVAADGIAGFRYGNGLAYRRRVDALGRVAELAVGDVFHRQWRYTPAGDIASIGDLLAPAEDRRYVYDALHRLTEAAGTIRWTYQYDANGNRLRMNTAVYTLDHDSNRLLEITDGSATRRFQYDAAGNRTGQTSASSALTYAYDARSRLARVTDETGELASYHYNGLGQRVVKRSATGTEYSLYSPKGQRISMLAEDGGLRHNTLYWNGRPLAHYKVGYRFASRHKRREASLTVDLATHRLQLTRYDGSVLDVVIGDGQWQVRQTGRGTVYHFAVGKGRDLKLKGWIRLHPGGQGSAHLVDKTRGRPRQYRLEGGQVRDGYYYHLDHLGMPQLMTDQNQTVVWQASYTPFGQATLLAESISNELRFPGQYHDRETGLLYNYFRYYDPGAGRYITSDPIGLNGGLNTYEYVGGNPVVSDDSYGLICGTGACAAIAGVIARVTASTIAKRTATKIAGNALIGGVAGGTGAFIASGGNPEALVDGALLGASTAFNPIPGLLGSFTSGYAGNIIGQAVVLDRNCQDYLEFDNYNNSNAIVSGVGSIIGGGFSSYITSADRSASVYIINRGLGAAPLLVEYPSVGLYEGIGSGVFEGIFSQSNAVRNNCRCSR